jgi:hypothetical protein
MPCITVQASGGKVEGFEFKDDWDAIKFIQHSSD